MRDMRDPQKLGLTLLRFAELDRGDIEPDAWTEWTLSDVYENNADTMEAAPLYRDVPAHLRYPRTHDLTVTTSYRRTPIERLAEGTP